MGIIAYVMPWLLKLNPTLLMVRTEPPPAGPNPHPLPYSYILRKRGRPSNAPMKVSKNSGTPPIVKGCCHACRNRMSPPSFWTLAPMLQLVVSPVVCLCSATLQCTTMPCPICGFCHAHTGSHVCFEACLGVSSPSSRY